MTREEAIELIESARKTMYLPKSKEYISDFGYALEMAIKALEQSSYNSVKTDLKSCTDAISRQSAIFLASDLKQDLPDDERIADMVMAHNEGVSEYQTQLSLLPSVNPTKTGHWIEKDGFDGDTYYDCSECGESWTTIEGTPWDNEFNYCPNCGAKMSES